MKTAIKIVDGIIFTAIVLGIIILILSFTGLGNIKFVLDSKIIGSNSVNGLEVVLVDGSWELEDTLIYKEASKYRSAKVLSVPEDIDSRTTVRLGPKEILLNKSAIMGKVIYSLPLLGGLASLLLTLKGWMYLLAFPLITFILYELKDMLPTLFVKHADLAESSEFAQPESSKKIIDRIIEKEEKFIDNVTPKLDEVTDSVEKNVKKIKL